MTIILSLGPSGNVDHMFLQMYAHVVNMTLLNVIRLMSTMAPSVTDMGKLLNWVSLRYRIIKQIKDTKACKTLLL